MPEKRTYHTRAPAYDVAAEFPWLANRAKTTVRLHPRRVEHSLPADASKAGGLILWPREEDWPVCELHSCPYVTVLQLRRDEFPGVPFPEFADLLQLLWCPNDHDEYGYAPAPHIVWRNSADVTNPLHSAPQPVVRGDDYEDLDMPGVLLPAGQNPWQVLPPPGTGDSNYIPQECALHPERVVEYPSAFELSEAEMEMLEAWWPEGASAHLPEEDDYWDDPDEAPGGGTLYQYLLSSASGTKVGGYPDWCQDPQVPVCDCGTLMEHLVTVDSCEWDGGSYPRWCAVEDADVWNADYEQRDQVQCPMGCLLGDMGSIYFFVCRRCSPWRTASVFQCS